MCLNGMFVLRRLRSTINGLYVTETHPKVLYFALKNAKETDTEKKKTYNYGQELHDWLANKIQWTRQKRKEINRGLKITDNEHQWDALISAWAAFCGLSGKWPLNLLNEAHCRELLKKNSVPGDPVRAVGTALRQTRQGTPSRGEMGLLRQERRGRERKDRRRGDSGVSGWSGRISLAPPEPLLTTRG